MNSQRTVFMRCLISIGAVILPAVSLMFSGCSLSQQEVDTLNHRFRSRDPLLVQTTVDYMVKHKDPRFVAEAKRLLKESRAIRQTPPLQRYAEAQLHGAIRIIMESNRNDAAEFVLKELRQQPPSSLRVDRWVMTMAKKLDDPRVDAELYRIFTYPKAGYYIRCDVANILSGRKNSKFPAVLEKQARKGDELSGYLLARRPTPQNLPTLLWCLENQKLDSHYRLALAAAIGRLGDKRVLPYLLKIVQEDNQSEITTVIPALAQFKDPSATKAIQSLLKHEYETIRLAMANALASTGSAEAADLLAKKLDSTRNRYHADAIIRALKRCNTDACRKILWKHVREKSTDTWVLSALALVELGDKEAKAVLVRAITREPKSADLLFRIPYPRRLATPDFVELLLLVASVEHKNNFIVISDCHSALRKNNCPKIRKVIRKGLKNSNPRTRYACSIWATHLYSADMTDTLLKMLDDPDARTRRGVVKSLISMPLSFQNYLTNNR